MHGEVTTVKVLGTPTRRHHARGEVVSETSTTRRVTYENPQGVRVTRSFSKKTGHAIGTAKRRATCHFRPDREAQL